MFKGFKIHVSQLKTRFKAGIVEINSIAKRFKAVLMLLNWLNICYKLLKQFNSVSSNV